VGVLAPEPAPAPAGAAAETAVASGLPSRLPYGGDAQAATRQKSRDAIRAILAARDRAVRRGPEQWQSWLLALADERERRKAAGEALEAARAEEQAAEYEAARKQREDDREEARREWRKEKAEAPWQPELSAQMHNDVHGHFADAGCAKKSCWSRDCKGLRRQEAAAAAAAAPGSWGCILRTPSPSQPWRRR